MNISWCDSRDDGYNEKFGRKQMAHELPGCNGAWTVTYGRLETLAAAGGLLNTAAKTLELRGQKRLLWHFHESYIRIDWKKTGQNHEFFT